MFRVDNASTGTGAAVDAGDTIRFVPGTNMSSISQNGTTFTFNASTQGGGGGTTYSDGNGITIFSEIISIDLDGAADSLSGAATGSGLALSTSGLAHAGGI